MGKHLLPSIAHLPLRHWPWTLETHLGVKWKKSQDFVKSMSFSMHPKLFVSNRMYLDDVMLFLYVMLHKFDFDCAFVS